MYFKRKTGKSDWARVRLHTAADEEGVKCGPLCSISFREASSLNECNLNTLKNIGFETDGTC